MTLPDRAIFFINHVQFRITSHEVDGSWFALIAGDDPQPKRKDILFSGPVEAGMADQLRQIAAHIDIVMEGAHANDIPE